MLQRLGEERVGDAQNDGRRRLAAAQLGQLFEVGVVNSEERPVIATIAQRPDQAARRRNAAVTITSPIRQTARCYLRQIHE